MQMLPALVLESDLVSAIVPVLNGERFFNEAVSSILFQTHDNWEIVFVDDGSTDDSARKVRMLATQFPERITCLEHPGRVNRGTAASRNLALDHARGKYIAMLDIDDIWLPEKLARQIGVLERNPAAVMAYGPIVFWYGWTGIEKDKLRDFVTLPGPLGDLVVQAPEQILHNVKYRDGLPAICGVLIRREIIDEGLRFEESFRMYEDEVFFSKIALRYPVYLMSESFDLYRQHPDSVCAQAKRLGEWLPDRPNQARHAFLLWLERHIIDHHLDDGRLLEAIHVQLEAYS